MSCAALHANQVKQPNIINWFLLYFSLCIFIQILNFRNVEVGETAVGGDQRKTKWASEGENCHRHICRNWLSKWHLLRVASSRGNIFLLDQMVSGIQHSMWWDFEFLDQLLLKVSEQFLFVENLHQKQALLFCSLGASRKWLCHRNWFLSWNTTFLACHWERKKFYTAVFIHP